MLPDRCSPGAVQVSGLGPLVQFEKSRPYLFELDLARSVVGAGAVRSRSSLEPQTWKLTHEEFHPRSHNLFQRELAVTPPVTWTPPEAPILDGRRQRVFGIPHQTGHLVR